METLFLFMPGGSEWLLILMAILLLFGGKKIPELMRGLGKGIREFNDAKDNVKRSLEEGIRDSERLEEQQRMAAQKPQKVEDIQPLPQQE